MEERNGLEFPARLGCEILQEVEHQLAEVLVGRGGPEEILEPALRERRLGGISIDEGDSRALGGLACRGGHRGEGGANKCPDLLLRDETLLLPLAPLRLALMVDEHQHTLAAAS